MQNMRIFVPFFHSYDIIVLEAIDVLLLRL